MTPTLAERYAEVLRGGTWSPDLAREVRALGKEGMGSLYSIARRNETRARKDARARLAEIRAAVDEGRPLPASTEKEAKRLRELIDAPPLPTWTWIRPPRSIGRLVLAVLSGLASLAVIARALWAWRAARAEERAAAKAAAAEAPSDTPPPPAAPPRPAGVLL